MKIKQHISAFLIMIIATWLAGCEKEVIVPDLKGNLVGYLLTFNAYGDQPLSDNSKVLVVAKGLDDNYSAYSDASGRFEFQDLPAGTYELDFSKEGFGNNIMRGIRHLGGKPTILGYNDNQRMVAYVRLYKLPGTLIENITLENDSLVAEFVLDGTEYNYFPVFVFFSRQSAFDNKDADIRGYWFQMVNGKYKAPFNKTSLPFEAGATVYIKAVVVSSGAYGCVRMNEDHEYMLCSTGEIFYPTLGHESDQFSFVFPN